MDPLSIAAATTGLVGACVKISATLYTFIDDSRHVDSNVAGLCDEVLGLSRVLDAISKSWRQTPLIAVARADPNGDLWANVKASIEDTQKTLASLDKELGNVQKDSRFGGFMRKPTKQLKLNMRMKDIQVFRQQIQSHNSGMQSALQMINVCLLIHGQSSQELVARSLQDLKAQIGRVEVILQSNNSTAFSLTNQQDNQRISRTLQRLVSAAETFHSSASSVASGSTVWGGSVMGDPLSQDQLRTIEQWIPEPISEESASDHPDHHSENTRVTSPSTDHSSNAGTASAGAAGTVEGVSYQGPDSDSDIETDLRKKFEELAIDKLEQRDYAKAEVFLRKLLENEDEERPSGDAPLIRMKIASACCFQGRWAEAESIAIPIATGGDRVDINAFHILHALAVRRSQFGQTDQAARWCKRALWGKKRLLGKNDPSYYESMALLARLYDAQGDAIEAEACRSFTPSTTTVDDDPLSYLFRSMSGNWKSTSSGGTIQSSGSSAQPTRSTQSLLTTPPPSKPSLRNRILGNSQSPQTARLAGPTAQQLPAPYIPGYRPRRPSDPAELAAVAPGHVRSSIAAVTKPTDGVRLIICIDLGTTFTGVTYHISLERTPKKADIGVVKTWPGTSNISKARIPTVLYYGVADQTVVGWGPDIADALSVTGNPKEGVQKCEWFRLHLHGEDYHIVTNLPPLPPGKTAIDVVADYLFHLKRAVREDLLRRYPVAFAQPESRIEWCFTTAPGAGPHSKSAYRSAVLQAGFVKDEESSHLNFIDTLEASLFSAIIPGLPAYEIGSTVLVVKCGGGTVHSKAFELIKQKPLKFGEVTNCNGHSCGATALNRNFSDLLRAKIRKMNHPQGSKLLGRVYIKNILEFENHIKRNFRNNGQKWTVDIGFEAEFPDADIEEGYMVWTNEEILQCYEPVVNHINQLISNQIIAILAQDKALVSILLIGAFSSNDYLFEQVKLRVPPQLQSTVMRPSDPSNVAGKGAVTAQFARQVRITRRMYLVETQDLFQPGVDPEYYRITSLDGQDRCRYAWRAALPLNTWFEPDESKTFPMTKLIGAGERAIFEDVIYAAKTELTRYIVSNDTEIVGKVTTNLSHPDLLADLQKHDGPLGNYYRISYELVFSLTDAGQFSITSVYRGMAVGSCEIEFQ